MKKISIKLIVLIVAFISLTAFEIIVNDDKADTEVMTVYIANEEILSGTQIQDYMIDEVTIPKHLASEFIITGDVNGFATTSLQPGEFIYRHQISEKSPINLLDNERMITISCTIVEGNGWLFKINEMVDIIMVCKEGKVLIEDAKVCRLFSETLDETQPEYISLIVDIESSYQYYENVSKSQVYICKKH